jgi:hypothetical protein
MTNQACALCIDETGYLDLEVQATHGNTGPVRVCWPCLEKRVNDLMHDLDRTRQRFGEDGCHLSEFIFGFRIGIWAP